MWFALSVLYLVLLGYVSFRSWVEQEVTIGNIYYQRNRANARRKRFEKSLKRERARAKLVERNMAIRHGQVLAELEKAHEELDLAEQRYKDLAAQVVELLPAHEERQILSLFNKEPQ